MDPLNFNTFTKERCVAINKLYFHFLSKSVSLRTTTKCTVLKRGLFHSVSGLWRLGTKGTKAVTDGISEECGTNLKDLGVVLDIIPASENAGLQVEGP